MTEDQELALSYACSPDGGWPRAKMRMYAYALRDYRNLAGRGLVREIPEDAKTVNGEVRLHFVATEAGLAAFAKLPVEV